MTSSRFLPFGFVATVERATEYDDDGVPVGAAEPHTIERCARDQTSTIESIAGQQVVVTREQIICDDVDADVQPTDVLTLDDGSRWQVVGDVDRLRSPLTGWSPGCVIPVERASGANPPQPARE